MISLAIIFGTPICISGIADLVHQGVSSIPSTSTRQIETLDRGLIALQMENGDVYLSWRLLQDDPSNITFDVFRSNATEYNKKVNTDLITITTDFLDQETGNKSQASYYILPYINAIPGIPSENATIHNLNGTSYTSLALNGNYTASRIGIGDLDGDGTYDFVLKQNATNIDPAESEWYPSPSTYKIEAYLSNGTFLWQKDLGWDIEQGIWYSPFVVFDLDGNGRAEVAAKVSADGADHRGSDGRVQSGDERLAIYDGLTGEELCHTDWIPRWTQQYTYNSRNLMGVAYLDGKTPFLIIQRGIYDIIKIQALKFSDHALTTVWDWASTDEFGWDYIGQGSHLMHCADVDNDTKEEIIVGSCVLDDNGEGLWSTGFRHCDACYVGDIDPLRPGLEIFYGIEGSPQSLRELGYGMSVVDAKTGLVLWKINDWTQHLHYRGLVSDIDSRYPGMECYHAERDFERYWYCSSNGTIISSEKVFPYSCPAAVYWSAKPQRAVLVGSRLYDFESNATYLPNVEGAQLLWADIIGDWREEILTSLNGVLRTYSTTIPAQDRRPCLMYDPIYRADVTSDSNGYTQVPMLSFCISNSTSSCSSCQVNTPAFDLGLWLLTWSVNFISLVWVHIIEISISVGILIALGFIRYFYRKKKRKIPSLESH